MDEKESNISDNSIKSNNTLILTELIKNQNKNINNDKKLLYNDLKRISKYLNKSIFGNECSLWSGYVTIIKNDEKNSYINFYFNGRKYALHRLLFSNYIGDLTDSEYLKFKCINKGKCCNINHFYKISKTDIVEETDKSSSPIIKKHKMPTNKTSEDILMKQPNNSVNKDSVNKDSVNKDTPKNIIVGFDL